MSTFLCLRLDEILYLIPIPIHTHTFFTQETTTSKQNTQAHLVISLCILKILVRNHFNMRFSECSNKSTAFSKEDSTPLSFRTHAPTSGSTFVTESLTKTIKLSCVLDSS